MKNLIFIAIMSLLVSCSKETVKPVNTDPLVFGKYCGFCGGDCAWLYKIEGGKIYPDLVNSYNQESLKFSATPLSNDKYDKAKVLLSSLPEYLLAHKDTTLGCPDCYDQCAYYVEIMKGGVKSYWIIDTEINALPDEIKPFVQQMSQIIDELN